MQSAPTGVCLACQKSLPVVYDVKLWHRGFRVSDLCSLMIARNVAKPRRFINAHALRFSPPIKHALLLPVFSLLMHLWHVVMTLGIVVARWIAIESMSLYFPVTLDIVLQLREA